MVSVLFNEPKLLKSRFVQAAIEALVGFSALQRAEIAEIHLVKVANKACLDRVSVLFNEPKLLKSRQTRPSSARLVGFSALQRAEIAEIFGAASLGAALIEFQCSSTSRNC